MKLLIVILWVALANGFPRPESDDDDTRIIMGTEAAQMVPYQVSIRRSGSSSCGGSILDETTILTAAHCLQDITPRKLTIGVGSTNLNQQIIYPVSHFINHEDYNDGVIFNNDVALIKLSKPITIIPSRVETVSLPTSCSKFPYGEEGLASGWGRVKADVPGPVDYLMKIKLKIIHNDDPGCKVYNDRGDLSDTMFCAGGANAAGDTCKGDSGGPLTIVNADNNDAFEQYGIVSWGEGCNLGGYAGVYTNVCKVMDWIEKNKNAAAPAAPAVISQQPSFESVSQNFPSIASQQFPSFESPFPAFGNEQFPSFGGFPSVDSQFPAAGSQFPAAGSQFPSFGSQFPSFGSSNQQFPSFGSSSNQFPSFVPSFNRPISVFSQNGLRPAPAFQHNW